MARPDILDTSAWLDAIYHPERWRSLERSLSAGQVWLSSVVAAELYAGTRSPAEAERMDRVIAVLERVERVITPTLADYGRAGRLIARRIRLQGALQPRDHLADVLILVSAARLQGVVVTANLRHFESWRRLAVSSGLRVSVRGLAVAE